MTGGWLTRDPATYLHRRTRPPAWRVRTVAHRRRSGRQLPAGSCHRSGSSRSLRRGVGLVTWWLQPQLRAWARRGT